MGRHRPRTHGFLPGDCRSRLYPKPTASVGTPGDAGTFARAVGEFGSTILVSGNLAGRTQTAPLYIFAKFNEGQIEAANAIAIVLALFSFLIFSVLFFARVWLDVD